MVVLSGIMIQNLKLETGWHLRGTRRVGVSFEDVEVVQQCVCIFSTLLIVRSVGKAGGWFELANVSWG